MAEKPGKIVGQWAFVLGFLVLEAFAVALPVAVLVVLILLGLRSCGACS